MSAQPSVYLLRLRTAHLWQIALVEMDSHVLVIKFREGDAIAKETLQVIV